MEQKELCKSDRECLQSNQIENVIIYNKHKNALQIKLYNFQQKPTRYLPLLTHLLLHIGGRMWSKVNNFPNLASIKIWLRQLAKWHRSWPVTEAVGVSNEFQLS